MKKTCLGVAAACFILFFAAPASAQVERLWLTHRPVLGNHDREIRPRGTKPPAEPVYDMDATAFCQFFALPDDRWKWHFEVPDFRVRFIALDLNHISDRGTTWQTCHDFGKDSAQYQWYEKLMANRPPGFVVTLHNERNASIRSQERGSWHEMFRKGNLVISGFGYFAERAEVDGLTYVNTSLSGRGDRYPDPASKVLKSENNYVLMTFRKATRTLTAELKSLEGAVLDRVEFGSGDGSTKTNISGANKDANGFLVHEVESAYQTGTTQIRVLLPDQREKGKRYPVVYVLPVEAGTEGRYGDGLLEVQKHGLHNQHRAIFVAPTFSHLPWYTDHPSKVDLRQETYFLKVVLPFIEKSYPVKGEAGGRLLVGFSKSGWGAFGLLLRHPEVFGKAAAWDAPLMMEQANRFGMGDIFGTQENFEKDQITKLLKQRASELQQSKRLVLLGYGNFREHHEKAHALMQNLQIDHDYRDGPARKHDWQSGWLPEAVGLLVAADTRDDSKKEQAMLEGTWAATAEERNGEAADVLKDIQFQDVQLIFAGDRITIKAPGREQTGTLQLDPSKNPNTLDIRYQSRASEERFFPGIYTVDGDTLKVCLGTDGKHRPRAFATKPDAHVVLFVLKREKP